MRAVTAECFENLTFSLLIPVGTGGKLLDLDTVIQCLADNESLWIGKKNMSAAQLGDLCKAWLPPSGLLLAYDVFLSYRWVSQATLFFVIVSSLG